MNLSFLKTFIKSRHFICNKRRDAYKMITKRLVRDILSSFTADIKHTKDFLLNQLQQRVTIFLI